LKKWCKDIVEGAGGLRAYFSREAKSTPKQTDCVEWALRCLANPDNEGSGPVLVAIIEQRARKLGLTPDQVALVTSLFADLESNIWFRRVLGIK
jgi:hypothetical protein